MKVENKTDKSKPPGELDTVTPNFIFEAKHSSSSIKEGQFNKFFDKKDGKFLNVYEKKVVLYIKEYDPNLSNVLSKKNIPTDKVIVINGDTELKQFIEQNKGKF